MSFIYSLVALEPDIVLAEHTDYQGNFLQIVRIVLKKCTNSTEKIAIQYDSYTVYVYIDNKIKFLALTEDGINEKEAFAFLYDLKAELNKTLSYEKVIKLTAYQLNFKSAIQSMMLYYNMHPITMKTGENIDQVDPASKHIQEHISSIIEKESQISLIVIKETNITEATTQREVFNIESAINEMKGEDMNNKSPKSYLAIAGGITAFLMLFYYII